MILLFTFILKVTEPRIVFYMYLLHGVCFKCAYLFKGWIYFKVTVLSVRCYRVVRTFQKFSSLLFHYLFKYKVDTSPSKKFRNIPVTMGFTTWRGPYRSVGQNTILEIDFGSIGVILKQSTVDNSGLCLS